MPEEAIGEMFGQTPLPFGGPELLTCKEQRLDLGVHGQIQHRVSGNQPSPTQPGCRKPKAALQ